MKKIDLIYPGIISIHSCKNIGLKYAGFWGCIICIGMLSACANQTETSSIRGYAPSPDGKTIYFSEGTESECAIKALDLASGAIRVAAKFKKSVGEPICSPNGKWLLFSGGTDGTREQIERFDLANGKLQPFIVSSFSDSSPSLSPDGKTVAFTRYCRQRPRPYGYTAWSDADVWAGPLPLGPFHQVTHKKAIWYSPGAFLSDRKHVIVSRDMGDGTEHLYQIDIISNRMKQITKSRQHNQDPTVSPDGKVVLFISDGVDQYHSELWKMNPDGSSVKQVTYTGGRPREPRFLPDSHSLIFRMGGGIWRVDLNGSNLKKLYPSPV